MSRRERIASKLNEAMAPLHLEVVDESHAHSVPEGSESHFKVTLVTSAFEGKRLVERHRAVNALLADEFGKGLHALALHTMTPEEWFAKGGISPDSPECMGGSKTGTGEA
jgi:BolA protein